jgi:hypothetical protein
VPGSLRTLDTPGIQALLYLLAFVENDTAGMSQQIAWSSGKPGIEDVFLNLEADTSIYSGQLAKSRELSRRAVASAQQAKQKETAARYEAAAALREALLGNTAEARQRGGACALHRTRCAILCRIGAGSVGRNRAGADVGERTQPAVPGRHDCSVHPHLEASQSGVVPTKAMWWVTWS